jgi:hypothetical protein
MECDVDDGRWPGSVARPPAYSEGETPAAICRLATLGRWFKAGPWSAQSARSRSFAVVSAGTSGQTTAGQRAPMLGKWPFPNRLSETSAWARGLWIRRVLVRARRGNLRRRKRFVLAPLLLFLFHPNPLDCAPLVCRSATRFPLFTGLK